MFDIIKKDVFLPIILKFIFMKKLYTKESPTSRWRFLFSSFLMALCVMGGNLKAQVSGYTFSQSTGTFTSIATTGTVVTGSEATTTTTNDTTGWSIAIPFNFNFNGIDYASIYVNSNGGATFGTPTSTSSAVISATTAYSGAIGVMNRDLWGAFVTSGVTTTGSNIITNVGSFQGIEVGKVLNDNNGIPVGATITAFDEVAGTITMSTNATSSSSTAVVRYGVGKIYTSTEGTAPNRVFVIEWKGYNDYGTTAPTSNYLNFQLRLAETSNTVSVVYGPTFNINTTSRTNQIGLRGASNVDYNNRAGAAGDLWTATTAGTTNGATVARDNTNFPASGLTFTWTPQTCFAPINLNVTNVTLTTADLAWTASVSAPADGYDVYYSAVNTAPTASTVLNASNSVSSTGTSASVAGLSTGTTYYVWLRSKCSASDIGPWGYSGQFTTLCAVFTVPYTQNFDTTATGSSSNITTPNCWSYLETSGSAGYGYVTTGNAASAPNNFYLYNSSATTGNIMLVSPETVNLSDGAKRVKFSAKASTAGYTVSVGILTNPADPTTFTAIGSPISLTTTHAMYTVNIPAGTGSWLSFRHGLGGSFRSVYLDDITVENIPTCLEPSGVSTTAFTATSATLSWTAPTAAPANGYQVYYSTSNTAPTGATVLDANNSVSSATTSAMISGLTPNTVYYVWVRSNCSTTDQSVWIGSTMVYTGYCLPSGATYFIDQFTSSGAVTNINYSGTAAVTGGYRDLTATDKIANSVGSVTPIAISGDGTSTFGFAVWVDWNNNLQFETTERMFVTSSYANSTTGASITVPAATALGNYRARVQMHYNSTAPSDPCVTAMNGEHIDFTFEVVAPPTCVAPTGLALTTATAVSADIQWTASTTPPTNGYDIYYSTVSTPPTATTTPSVVGVMGTSAVITPLMPATTYYVWVRSNCATTDQSTWSAPITFVTNCVAVASFSENFDSTSTTGNILPVCWSKIATTTSANSYVQASTVMSGPNALYIYSNSATSNVYVKMPEVSTLSTGLYSLRFNARANFTAGGVLEIGYLTNPTDHTTFVVLGSYTSTSATAIDNYILNITGVPAGVTTLAFRHTGSPANSILMDDIQYNLTAVLGTSDSIRNAKDVTIYPNPFQDILNISDVKDVTSAIITDISGRTVKTIAKPTAQLQLGGLTAGMYLVTLKYKDGSVKTMKAIKK
ncbi:MAG: fibronectin type III domain-containing protein [Kaistella sp.]|nr:fibronectin type III domain-containing protein [Kaistella sp.]